MKKKANFLTVRPVNFSYYHLYPTVHMMLVISRRLNPDRETRVALMWHEPETLNTIEKVGGERETQIRTQSCLDENTEKGRGGNVVAEGVTARLRF